MRFFSRHFFANLITLRGMIILVISSGHLNGSGDFSFAGWFGYSINIDLIELKGARIKDLSSLLRNCGSSSSAFFVSRLCSVNNACSVSYICENEAWRLDFPAMLSFTWFDFLRFNLMYSFWIKVFSLSVKTSNSVGASLSHGCSRA